MQGTQDKKFSAEIKKTTVKENIMVIETKMF
jgi:hypothetical protein